MGPFLSARKHMVEEQLVARGVRDRRVLDAMTTVPRHMFVPAWRRGRAYADGAVEIGYDQTISQPYMVAVMTAALDPRPFERVLEIGTGSGYQTAVLAELASEVFTIERLPALAEEARETLEELGYGNIRYRIGDGTGGWPDAAPFDGILVTAGAPALPRHLREQAKPGGGRIVIPIGGRHEQELYVYRTSGEELSEEWITTCRFVPLLGQEGWGSSNA